MKVFRCDHCMNLVFFENFQCVHCGHQLAYLPDLNVIGSLDPAGAGLWTSPILRAETRVYRLCENFTAHNTCNWAVPAAEDASHCLSCRLTSLIPDLAIPGHREAWYKLEVAKRRMVYTLAALGLPLVNKTDDPVRGLSFEFKADPTAEEKAAGIEPVMTGHADGVITINIAEADEVEREKRRIQMHEPYRTLLGHFRHEVGHYYWDLLIRDDEPRLAAFRDRFGDERADYSDSLKKHYRDGPAADWQDRFVTTYATSHPWEDWAETWAHYLHIFDTLEMAVDSGLTLKPREKDRPQLEASALPTKVQGSPFEQLVESWLPLTYVLNNLNRGLGLPDTYPFVLSDPVIHKLKFIHETIAAAQPLGSTKS